MMKQSEGIENREKLTDEQLISRFQNGDISSFDVLVRRYQNPLFNYVSRFVGDTTEAEDIVQETFYRLYRNKHYYKEIAKFSTWIYTIAGNLARTELRRKKKRKYFSINFFMSTDKDYDIPDPASSPEEKLDAIVTDEIIQKAITKLAPKFKEVILLRDVQGFSYDEIAEIVDVPLGTIKSRVNRARLKLQEDLSDVMEN
jgi:RNA polymerase sigma-70 factor (ECF subfamily)